MIELDSIEQENEMSNEVLFNSVFSDLILFQIKKLILIIFFYF